MPIDRGLGRLRSGAGIGKAGSVNEVSICSIDFASYSNGGLPAPFTGATWAVSSGVAVNTPTVGAELLTDGGLETWSSATDATNWTENLNGTSSIAREGTVVHSGSYAAKLTVDGSNSLVSITQSPTMTQNTWSLHSCWTKSSATSKTGRMTHVGVSGPIRDPGTTYTQYFETFLDLTATGAQPVGYQRQSAASASLYVDDYSAKNITHSTLTAMASTELAFSIFTVQASITLSSSGAFTGFVVKADASSDPTQFILAAMDGTTARLLKRTGTGTYTSVITTTAITYQAGATLKLIKNGTTYSLFYNGAQVGTSQTISDADIVNNKYFGLFGSYSTGSISSLRITSP